MDDTDDGGSGAGEVASDSAGVYFMSVEEFESRPASPAPSAVPARRWFELEAVGIDFLERAPVIHVVECDVALPRTQVWDAFVDPLTWPSWFPGVREASYRGVPPYGVGTIRVANVSGFAMEETMLAWDDGRRWAYRIDRSTAPLARAQLECTEFFDSGAGTRVRWTFALRPGWLMALVRPFFRRTVARLLARALRNLEQLHAGGPGAHSGGRDSMR